MNATKTRILVTCPPMLGAMHLLEDEWQSKGCEFHCPDIDQVVPEEQLVTLVPQFDGWIIGDDPATRKVFDAAVVGRLRAAVKWGIGIDNVDIAAAKDVGITVKNTPGMFGAEVADVAMCYLTGLARELFFIDRRVRSGGWPKPRGVSLRDKIVGIVGYGDIGRNLERRCHAAGLQSQIYDPAVTDLGDLGRASLHAWPADVENCDFLVFTCSLNDKNFHMLDAEVLGRLKPAVRIVNVARGGLIDEGALTDALARESVHSVALDVFEVEPLPADSPLLSNDRCIFGSHNSSNSVEAVLATSRKAMSILLEQLSATKGSIGHG